MVTNKKTERAVVVTTEHRGVFFGYLEKGADKSPESIELRNCRMCVYWSAETKGVLGLAATGPVRGCKITHQVPKMIAYKITAVLDCAPEAVAAWEAGIWG